MTACSVVSHAGGGVRVTVPAVECDQFDGAAAKVPLLHEGAVFIYGGTCAEHGTGMLVRDVQTGNSLVLYRVPGHPHEEALRELHSSVFATHRSFINRDTPYEWMSGLPTVLAEWGVDVMTPVREQEDATVRALRWREHGHSAMDAQAWEGHGVTDPRDARVWGRHIPKSVAGRFVRAGITDPEFGRAWARLGVPAEDVPQRWRDDPRGWELAHEVTGEADPDPAWAQVRATVSLTVAEEGFEQGQTPAAVTALSAAAAGSVTGRNLPWLHSLRGLDWGDVATCLRAGMPLAETCEHLRAGRDMEAVRVMAALAP